MVWRVKPRIAQCQELRRASSIECRDGGAARTGNDFGLTFILVLLPQEQQRSQAADDEQMNMRAVFLHVVGDALGSVIVIMSALVIMFVPVSLLFGFDLQWSLALFNSIWCFHWFSLMKLVFFRFSWIKLMFFPDLFELIWRFTDFFEYILCFHRLNGINLMFSLSWTNLCFHWFSWINLMCLPIYLNNSVFSALFK